MAVLGMRTLASKQLLKVIYISYSGRRNMAALGIRVPVLLPRNAVRPIFYSGQRRMVSVGRNDMCRCSFRRQPTNPTVGKGKWMPLGHGYV